MNCPRCQNPLRENDVFCSKCGLSVVPFNTPTERVSTGNLQGTQPSDPLIGHILDGKYELLARLGEGGMGTVYRARRVHIGDEVAVKVLLQKYVAEGAALERFRREARAAAMLRHTNVVAIYDFGEARGDAAPAYIVMELVEGESLRQLLQRERWLKAERAVSLMRDVCAGVGAAHRRNIVHRDLKPDNIIVLPPDEYEEHETAKVVDFGIAKLRDLAGGQTLTQTGAVMGTPYYMSPEQCRGDSLDARSDVYSLGAMLYEMLAGVPPFIAKTPTGVVAKHLMEEPPPLPDSLNVSPELEKVVLRALSKDPEKRQADAMALSRELRDALRPSYAHALSPTLPAEEAKGFPLSAEEKRRLLAQEERERLRAQARELEAKRREEEERQKREQEEMAARRAAEERAEREREEERKRVQAKQEAERKAAEEEAKARAEAEARRKKEEAEEARRRVEESLRLVRERERRAQLEASSEQIAQPQDSDWKSPLPFIVGGFIVIFLIVLVVFLVSSSSETANTSNTNSSSSNSTSSTTPSSSSDNTASLTYSLKRTLTGHTGNVWAVAISPDGSKIASAGADHVVILWDAQTGSLLGQPLKGHDKDINTVAFSPDSRMVASGSNDGKIIIWDNMSQTLVRTLNQNNEVYLVAFSTDGQTLASVGKDNLVRLWNIQTGALYRTLSGHTDIIWTVAFSPDGKTIASGGKDNTIMLWDAQSGNALATLHGHTSAVISVAFSPDGKSLASGSNDNTVKIWNWQAGSLRRTLTGHTSYITSVAYSRGGQTLASASNDKTVRLWDAETGGLRQQLTGYTKGVTSVAFSPDSRMLATASGDGSVKVWEGLGQSQR